MSVASDHVAFFRTQWANRFVDTVTITDLTTRGTFNRTTKKYDNPAAAVVYTGGALIRPAGVTSRDSTTRAVTSQVVYDFDIHLPHTATGIQPGNTVTIDAVYSLGDQDLPGTTLTVEHVVDDTYDTHSVVRCNRSQDPDRG